MHGTDEHLRFYAFVPRGNAVAALFLFESQLDRRLFGQLVRRILVLFVVLVECRQPVVTVGVGVDPVALFIEIGGLLFRGIYGLLHERLSQEITLLPVIGKLGSLYYRGKDRGDLVGIDDRAGPGLFAKLLQLVHLLVVGFAFQGLPGFIDSLVFVDNRFETQHFRRDRTRKTVKQTLSGLEIPFNQMIISLIDDNAGPG